jgi:hypothetical protein
MIKSWQSRGGPEFLKCSDIQAMTGRNVDDVRRMMAGVPALDCGKRESGKYVKYHITDVAKRFVELMN